MINQTFSALIIEDNLLNLELVTDLLQAAGHTVLQAHTAEEGIHLAKNMDPDIILMDISLPGMDGLAAIRVLRADPLARQVPIVALTAHAMKGDHETALQAGADSYVTKPINTRTFIANLQSLLHKRLQPSHA